MKGFGDWIHRRKMMEYTHREKYHIKEREALEYLEKYGVSIDIARVGKSVIRGLKKPIQRSTDQ